MRNCITNEFEDKRIPKVIVRYLQSIYKNWTQVPNYSLIQRGSLREYKFPGYETFFGYYDRSPFNTERSYLLFYRSPISTKFNPRLNTPIELVLWDNWQEQIIKIWKIWSYNWQQGSKAQWISNYEFIFNNYDSNTNSYIAIVVDINNLSEKRLEYPSYESCKDFCLTLNFNRLSQLRPDYGYRNIVPQDLNDNNDGVFIHHFKNNKTELIISISDLCKLSFKESMKGAQHKVNHIMLTPDGSKFMFMHRWIKNGIKEDRLYIYDFSAKTLRCVADYGMVSHCYWWSDYIIGYMKGPSGLPGYYKIDTKDASINLLSDYIQYFGDGHPSIYQNMMVFDTYPDSQRLKYLYMYDLIGEKLIELGSFKEALGYECQCRCDLHPRLVDQNIISFDSTHSGTRCFCVLTLDK